MDNEVPLSRVGGGCGAASPGVAEGDWKKSGDDDLCRGDQPRSRTLADRDTAACIGIASGAVFEGEEFAQAAGGVRDAEEALLGQHLWGRSYWVATSGNVTDEVWKKYIEDQKPEEPDDNFKVV